MGEFFYKGFVMKRPRNFYAVGAHFRKAGAMKDMKKEKNKFECRDNKFCLYDDEVTLENLIYELEKELERCLTIFNESKDVHTGGRCDGLIWAKKKIREKMKKSVDSS